MALGAGQRSNPLLQADDVPLYVDVDIAWFGERAFFDNGDLGLSLVDNRRATVSAVARVNSDRVFFGLANLGFLSVGGDDEDSPQEQELEVPDRNFAAEAGIELLTDGSWGQLQMSLFHDVSGTHDGYEASADYSIGLRRGRWYFQPALGVLYKSQNLNDYYWGVRDDEANDLLRPYRASAGLNVRGRLGLSYFFNKRWSAAGVLEVEKLNPEATASPLVTRDVIVGYFAGIRYRF